jgi:hypothetical protein
MHSSCTPENLRDIHGVKKPARMVPRAGVEPATCPLGGGRAIHCAIGA